MREHKFTAQPGTHTYSLPEWLHHKPFKVFVYVGIPEWDYYFNVNEGVTELKYHNKSINTEDVAVRLQ